MTARSSKIGPAFLCALLAIPVGAVSVSFDRFYVDTQYGGNGRPGWVRAGDMDLDGDLDIVAGGGLALYIYENNGAARGWTRWGSLDSTGQIGANGGVLFDVDNDTDLDIVCAKYKSDLGWWENPGGQLSHATWTFHQLSTETYYLHDMILADIDQDGVTEEIVANLNQGYWNATIKVKWFRPGAQPTQTWEAHTIEPGRSEGPPHGHAGLDVGDVDRDGNVDLAYANGWYEAPDDPTTGSWTWHEVTQIYGVSNALLRHMNADVYLDLVVSAGHHGYGVYWYAAPADPINGTWTLKTVDADIHHPECLAVLDLDEDDDPDIVTCDLFFGEDPGEPGWDEQVHNIYVFENLGGSISWQLNSIAPNSYPSHLLQMVDINKDGAMDIISEATGTSVVTYYENTTPGLGCIDDTYEPDDSCEEGSTAILGELQAHRHCDEDWLRFDAVDGATYEIGTRTLTGGADTVVELYAAACGAFLDSDDDFGPGLGSLLVWQATADGSYAVRIVETEDQYANGKTYQSLVDCVLDCGNCTGDVDLDLVGPTTVTTTEVHEACHIITVGPDFHIESPGDVTFRAGNLVILKDGFQVGTGAGLTIEIDRTLR